MDSKILASIEGKKRTLDQFRPLPPALIEKLRDEFALEWTFNTNALEGNTLSLQETDLVINRGVTIGGKSLKEHFEAINHIGAVKYLYRFSAKKEAFSEEFILRLHKFILTNIDDASAGSYRHHNVRILGSYHLPPNAQKIGKLMREFVDWYYLNDKSLSVAELSAQVHYRLVHIHPFLDGNGRTARLLMNLVLIQNGYPPAVIMNLDRKKYYRVLKEADLGKAEPFENFIGKSIERSLVIYLNTIVPPQNRKKEKQGYISLQEATKYCEYSQEYLSLLARTGKLAAVKFGRNWMTTPEAVREYLGEHQNSKSPGTRSKIKS
ncbi:MAG: Fic family protein [Desulfobacteraceae bacterium]|nr:MAG: Fic family protein [Desulfobacteraceae bacterium]